MNIMSATEVLELSKLCDKHKNTIMTIMEGIKTASLKGETSLLFKSKALTKREVERIGILFESYGYKVDVKDYLDCEYELVIELKLDWGENE